MNQSSKLNGIRIWVTRPAPKSGGEDELVSSLRNLGAEVGHFPVLVPEFIDFSAEFRRGIERLGPPGSIVFLSRRAVDSAASAAWFQDWLGQNPHIRLIAIGSGTADEIREVLHREVDFPPESNSRSLARWLFMQPETQPSFILRAEIGSVELESDLKRFGYVFHQVAAYRTTAVARPSEAFERWLAAGPVSWITATSPRMVEATCRLISRSTPRFGSPRFATLSPSISHAVRQAGFCVGAEATAPTLASLVEAISRAAGDSNR